MAECRASTVKLYNIRDSSEILGHKKTLRSPEIIILVILPDKMIKTDIEKDIRNIRNKSRTPNR